MPSPPSSPSSSPRPRRTSGARPPTNSHIPVHPSRLREATALSPEDHMARSPSRPSDDFDSPSLGAPSAPASSLAQAAEPANFEAEDVEVAGEIIEPSAAEVIGENTRLLESYHHNRVCGLRNSSHGTFSPFPGHSRNVSDDMSLGERDSDSLLSETSLRAPPDAVSIETGAEIGGSKAFNSSTRLAQKHGIRSRQWLYYSYYFPAIRWMSQYKWSWLRGDLVAAITMASFYIPMALSYASNLAHVPPINGLYSFVFNPVIYALLGTCPQMVVGPEAAGSLLVGQVVRICIDRGNSGDDDDVLNAQIAGVVTVMAGSIIFIAGIARLGFLDGVLSRPFLRGFISAIGFVILVDQAIPELGLTDLSKEDGNVSHGSSVEKLVFLVQNIRHSHALTAAVSLGSFAIIMVFRTLKTHLQPRYPSVAYFPDRFLVVVLSAVFTWLFAWDKKGLDILGQVKSSGSTAIPFHWPFQFKHMVHIDSALSTSFIIALFGFFESSVAAKSLGEGTSGLRGIHLSANRELVALGTANLLGGMFQSLPAFGGYGRSKVNAATGGTTPMSSILLSLITLICVLFLLPYFYYLPKGVLSAMVSVVAYSLVEECPHDINFFFRIRGWTELLLMAIIFLSTIFYSLTVGIALGIGLSLLALIRHATKPRIQILGKVPGTTDRFENAEYFSDNIEYIEGCLIVKIPEPLTFANTGALKTRLSRLEAYGSNRTHPSLPHIRSEEHNRNIIFDVHGVTSIDGSGTQVLSEIVEAYMKKAIHLPIHRRGGRFATHAPVNFTQLAQAMSAAEARYTDSYRDIDRNGLVRRWRQKDDLIEDVGLLYGLGRDGTWFATVTVGDPPQDIDLDLDMLHPDFLTVVTTSNNGRAYNTTGSLSHGQSDLRIHPLCRMATDEFALNPQHASRLVFPICTPPQSTVHTLLTQGSILGLGPPGSLSRIPDDASLMRQLYGNSLIPSRFWSITLLDSTSGILSLGTTISVEVEKAKLQAEAELQNIDQSHATPEWIQSQIETQVQLMRALPWEDHFKWTDLQGAKGWWTTLMSAVWVDGAKVLKNQPVLFDIQCPFILAPPMAAARVYYSIGGAFRLPSPQDQYFAFPCLNAVNLAFEIAGWNFPGMMVGLSTMTTRADQLHGPVGGRFSLGLLGEAVAVAATDSNESDQNSTGGTGYCIGVLVETRMGMKKKWQKAGMEGVWVLGEPFFRGLGLVFDQENNRIGLRIY
ncbi:hypothetical protein DV736_g3333, partial [Chaetothyriales sp. CBS 134916]